MSSSSALSDCLRGLAQGGSRRAGSWNSSEPMFGSSTPRARRRDTSQAPSSSSRESFPSSPPIVFGRTPSSRDPSPTPTGPTSTAVENLTSSFEKWNNDTFFRYKEEYNATWCKWIDARPQFKSFVDALPRDKRTTVRNRGMNWGNVEVRSSPFWEHFQEGASSGGVPQIRCVWCMQTIQHPIKNGNSGMKDHYESNKCITQRRKKVQDPTIVDALRKQGEKVAGIRRQRDIEIPDVITQDAWDAQLLRAFLSTGLAFNAVANKQLRATWMLLKKDIKIPCRATLRRRLDKYYESVKKAIKTRIPKSTKISLAIDSWTSPNHLAFLAIIGYFITPNWELKEVMLGFENLPEGHTGKEQAEVVYQCLERYGLQRQLGAVTSDNATVNETVNAELAKLLQEEGITWDPVQNKIGCLAHTVQLILGVFIDSLKLKATNESVPTSLKKGKIAKVVDMPPGFKKIIEKVRQLAVAILASPQRNGYFLKLQEGREEVVRSMIRDVSTRWNSTLQMLDRALALRDYIRHWVEKYPAYRGLLLTGDEWLLMEDVLMILQPFRFYTLWISSSQTATIHRSLEVYSAIQLVLQKRLNGLKRARLDWKVELRTAVEKTLEYANRLWDNLDSVHLSEEDRPRYPDTNRAMPIREDTILDLAAVLDPFSKLENFRGWDRQDEAAEQRREVSWTVSYRQRFIDFWKVHYAPNLKPPRISRKRRWTTAFDSDASGEDSNDEESSHEAMISEMQKLVEKYLDSEVESVVRGEQDPAALNLVVNKGSQHRQVIREFYSDSVLDWWAKNSDRKELYPLAQMARDILATPASAVACEAAFSSGRDLCHYRRSKMTPETITRAMICKHFDRATIDEDVEELDDNSNDAEVELAQRLRALEIAASQFDVIAFKERAKKRKRSQRDLSQHRSLTEGAGEGDQDERILRKHLGQIEHDGAVEFEKPLPPLPDKRYTKAQDLLPRATGTEKEYSLEQEKLREADRLPRVDWDAVSDFSGSDSDEEREQRAERQRRREKGLQNRTEALVKARRIRPVASHRRTQKKGKQPTRRQEDEDAPPPKSPRLMTPPRRRQQENVASLSALRPRRVMALVEEGAYKV